MPTNQFFKNFNSFPQQELLNDLTKEVIQINGIDVLYLERITVKRDNILDEDALSKFTRTREVEMYINTPEGFGGAGDVVSKFGLDVQDELILIVNKERFVEEVFSGAPREGDLIYFPLSNGIFEIKFVEDENPFYQAGKLYQFKVVCQLFQYSHETFNTGMEQIDSIEEEHTYSVDLQLGEGSGLFVEGEFIWQGESQEKAQAVARVVMFDAAQKIIRINNIVGNFSLNVPIKGATNGGNYILTQETEFTTDTYANNQVIETEADDVLDFTESNPFGEI